MKILQEINDLWKKVNFFYLLEGILISTIFSITVLLFLNYFSFLNNLYIIALLPLPTYLFYILIRKKPELDKVILNSDRYLSLEERLITAWEYREYNEPYGLMENLIKDLEKKLSDKSLKDSYKWKPSKFLKILSLIMVILIILNIARSVSPIQKKSFISEKEKLEEELPLDLKKPTSSKLQVSKEIQGEKLTEEKREKEKSLAEKEKDKTLEKLLSEWDFEEEKLIEELLQKKATSSNKDKPSLNPQEKPLPTQESISQYMQQKNASLNELLNRETNLDKNSSNESYGMEEKASMEGLKENKIRDESNINLPSKEQKKDMESQDSLPGTEERKEKLGSKPTPRLNVNPEKVYVPSQGIDESKKKVYLFEAPSLKEDKEKSIVNITSPIPQYKVESSTSPRIIPQDLQEIIKLYFSQ